MPRERFLDAPMKCSEPFTRLPWLIFSTLQYVTKTKSNLIHTHIRNDWIIDPQWKSVFCRFPSKIEAESEFSRIFIAVIYAKYLENKEYFPNLGRELRTRVPFFQIEWKGSSYLCDCKDKMLQELRSIKCNRINNWAPPRPTTIE